MYHTSRSKQVQEPHMAKQSQKPTNPTPEQLIAQSESAESFFQSLLDAAPDAIVIVNEHGRIVIVNRQTEKLFGYQRDELLNQEVEILLPTGLHRLHSKHRSEYVADPHTRPMGLGLNLSARRKDGGIFPVEISLSPLRTEQGLLVTSVIRDITERRQAAELLEQQVQKRTAHLNTLLQFSRELFSADNLNDVLQRALNHTMALVPQADRAAIYLYNAQEDRLALRASVGFNQLPDLGSPSQYRLIKLAFEQQKIFALNHRNEWQTKTGNPSYNTPLQKTLQLEQSPSGFVVIPLTAHEQVIGVILLLREDGDGPFATEAKPTLQGIATLTATALLEDERNREAASLNAKLARLEDQQQTLEARLTSAEAAMLQAARLAAVGELAASIAHEINNPLYAARNSLYLHADDLPEEYRDSPYLQIAREQMARIAGIIERMRSFYRPDRGELAPADLNQIIEGTLALVDMHVRHKPISLIFTPAPDLPQVVCNADQLRQVFLNIMLNGIDAMSEGGSLIVRTIAGASFAVAEISDTGVGIPADVQARLFDPFFTTKSNGTGLGLSISAHIVTQHGGQIEVESQEGQGTTIRVVLPYQPRDENHP
jgi:two-component system NtrC family sensor kinase